MTTKTDIEQERADFEAWHKRVYGRQPVRSRHGDYQATLHNERWMIWEAIAALQSQDREIVVDALEAAQNNIGPRRPVGSSDPDSNDYNHDSFMWDFHQRAIDHARRVEGDGE